MTISREELFEMKKSFTYRGVKTREILYPLGGIGTGCINLAGNGRLADWEIFNRPNQGGINGNSFFAIKVEKNGEVTDARILQGDAAYPDYIGAGRGTHRGTLAGLPHFKTVEFEGKYPFARLKYMDESFPLRVEMEAFSPFIPLDSKDSSLPAAVFCFTVENTTQEAMDVCIAANMTNPHYEGLALNAGQSWLCPPREEPMRTLGTVHAFFQKEDCRGIKLYSNMYSSDSPRYGDISISTDAEEVSWQTYGYRGKFRFEGLGMFWKEFTAPGRLKERCYPEEDAKKRHHGTDTALLAVHAALQPGEKREIRYAVTWSFPNFLNYWNPLRGEEVGENQNIWKNYYATIFEDSSDTAGYVFGNYKRLYCDSLQFEYSLYSSTLPDTIIDAIAGNLSILRSPTVLRLSDGTFYGWEGYLPQEGSCEGSCTHVWNYVQSVAFLFPDLQRSMDEAHFKYNQYDSGKVNFRILLPLGREKKEAIAAVDGQMGLIFNIFREWKISGDNRWLRGLWPQVKKALEFVWSSENSDKWDADMDGVIEGRQHHTLDTELYGPSSYLTGYYLLALLAASKMAEAIQDPAAEKYAELYKIGCRWVEEHLFNGEYYQQEVNLSDSCLPLNAETGELDYQIAGGCHIDQVIAQWYAHIGGLGYLFDKERVCIALSSLYKYNFKTMRHYPNTFRVFALDDEKGLIMTTWPKEKEPLVPVRFATECMTGFEYQAACHMIYEGLMEEGLDIVKAVRDRYDGEKRNPWNELECGSRYSRAMASYSLLLAMSGFTYDMTRKMIGFAPPVNREEFTCFWCLNEGWGVYEQTADGAYLHVQWGSLSLNVLKAEILTSREKVTVELLGWKPECRICGNEAAFTETVRLVAGSSLKISWNKGE